MSRPSPQFEVHSTKHDGSLHYRFETDAIHVGDSLLALHLRAGSRLESYRGTLTAAHDILMLMWKGRRWKLSVRWEAGWVPHDCYVDIITPAVWDDGTLRLTDMDLDLILKPGLRLPLLDDADEFQEHAERFAYSEGLVSQCHAAVVEVAALMSRQAYPFDGSLYAWRPGLPLPVDRLV